MPDQREYNFKIDYHPPWLATTVLRGLRLTVRGAFYERQGTGGLDRQIHVILDWEWDILAPGGRRARWGS